MALPSATDNGREVIDGPHPANGRLVKTFTFCGNRPIKLMLTGESLPALARS